MWGVCACVWETRWKHAEGIERRWGQTKRWRKLQREEEREGGCVSLRVHVSSEDIWFDMKWHTAHSAHFVILLRTALQRAFLFNSALELQRAGGREAVICCFIITEAQKPQTPLNYQKPRHAKCSLASRDTYCRIKSAGANGKSGYPTLYPRLPLGQK